MAHPQHHWKFD